MEKTMETLEKHENLNAQPEKLQELLATPRLCQLLNPKLDIQKLNGISREHFIVPVEHEGEPHNAVILGFYRHAHNEEVERTAREEWEEPEVPQPNTGEFQEGIVAIQAPRIDIAREDFFWQNYYLRVFHNSVSVFISPQRAGDYRKALGPSVVRARQIPNGAGSGEPELQG